MATPSTSKAKQKASAKTKVKALSANRPATAKKKAVQPKRPEKRVSEAVLYGIIDRMCEGESLRQICKDEKVPSVGTVLRYALAKGDLESEEYVVRFAAAYAMAKELRAEAWADEIVGISDDVKADKDEVSKAKLRVDTRKWLLSKLLKQYGDKSAHEISGPGGGPVETSSSVSFYLPKNGREKS